LANPPSGPAVVEYRYIYLAIAAANSGERARKDSRSWAVRVLDTPREVWRAMVVGNATVSSDATVGFAAADAAEACAIWRWINAFRAFAANSDCALPSKLSDERIDPGFAATTAADSAIDATPHIQNLFIRPSLRMCHEN
jgi:hypothetical protein